MSVITRMPSIDLDTSPIPKRKLILHFDQHNTIQVVSSLPGRHITVEEGLNNFLTSACWGKETNDGMGEWQWVSDQPQINKPQGEPNAITYFKYLEKKIVKTPDDRPELKKQTSKFVYDEPGIKFKEFFDLYLQSLTYQKNYNQLTAILDDIENLVESSDETDNNNNNNNNNSHHKCLEDSIESRHNVRLPSNTIIGGNHQNTSLYHLILPEFFDMIRRLQKDNREFTIILRTMGIESKTFLDTVKPIFEGKHRDFKDIKPIKINTQIGKIERSENDKIKLIIGDETFDNDIDIYNKLSSLTGINAIRDDFAYWQRNDYDCYASKPLWIDLNDKLNHHIIFDDNIRLDAPDDCIVNLRLNEESEYENVDFKSYYLFENSCMVQPNLIELLNPHLKLDSKRNHYLDKINKSERKYNRLLENRQNYTIYKKSNEDENKNSFENNNFNNSTVNQNGELIVDRNLSILKHRPKSLLVVKKTNRAAQLSEKDEKNQEESKTENIVTKTCTIQ
jgi:hypothetical protein